MKDFNINEFRVSPEYHKMKRIAKKAAFYVVVLPVTYFGSKMLAEKLAS